MKEPLKNRIGRLMPTYSWVCLGVVFLFQSTIFWGTRPILAHLTPLDLGTALDELIPFQPAWVCIYVLSSASWNSVRACFIAMIFCLK